MLAGDRRRRGAPLPETVQGIIAARLDTLAGEEKGARPGRVRRGEDLLGRRPCRGQRPSDFEVEQGLQRLERTEFVRRERRSSVAGETAFVFRHVLVRDVAYGQIPRPRRAELHRRTAGWLESLAGDRAEDIADLIAHHYLSALQFARAAGRGLGDLPERARIALAEAATARSLSPPTRPRCASTARRSPPGGGRPRAAGAAPPLRPGALPRGADRRRGARRSGERAARRRRGRARGRGRGAPRGPADDHPGTPREAISHFETAAALLAERPRRARRRACWQAAPTRTSRPTRLRRPSRWPARRSRWPTSSGWTSWAHALSTRGFSRVMIGDLDGLRDLQESVRVASSAELSAGRARLQRPRVDHGRPRRPRRAFELYAESRQGREALRRHAGAQLARRRARLRVLLAWRLDTGPGGRDRLLGEGEDGLGSLHEVDVLLIRAKILLAREGAEPALECVEKALAIARSVGAPQILFPVLAFEAHALVAAGQGEAASDVAQEPWRSGSTALADTRSRRSGSRTSPSPWWSWAEGTSSWNATSRTPTKTRWLEAAQGACSGDWRRAASTFSRIGSLPDEALARLRAAADLEAADTPGGGRGRTAPGERVLSRGRSRLVCRRGRVAACRRRGPSSAPARSPRGRRACPARRPPCTPLPHDRDPRRRRARTRRSSASGRRREPRCRTHVAALRTALARCLGPGLSGSISHQWWGMWIPPG